MPSVRGFTLIELLIVIAIISILSVVGIVLFTGIQKEARDSKRRADIDAIAKAYEVKNSSGSYVALSDSDFSSGKKPQDLDSSRGQYFNWLPQDGSGFKACASLDDNPNSVCNTPATNCYCKVSTQGTLNPSSPVNQGGSTQYSYGIGGSQQSSCDPNGTLLSGLVGYWKMDETAGSATATDSSGQGNNGTYTNGATTTTGQLGFGNAGSFDGNNDYIGINADILQNLTQGTIAFWFSPRVTFTGVSYQWLFTRASGADEVDIALRQTDKRLKFRIRNAGTYTVNIDSNTANWTGGQWYHVVATFGDSSGAKVYINNQQESTTPVISSPTSTGVIAIGSNSGAYPFDGKIDDVRIYNRVLSGGFSGSEISNLYNGCVY